MKTITKNTILKQGDKVYQPEDAAGDVFWWDNSIFPSAIVAQSKPMLDNVPVISLDSYVERLAKKVYQPEMSSISEFAKDNANPKRKAFIKGFKSNPNKWTDEDLVKAIELARKFPYIKSGEVKYEVSAKQILEQISSINEIEVDENFNVINFK